MNLVDTFQRMHQRAQTHDPSILISVVKSDNTNMVVYQAKVNDTGLEFTDDSPHGYWQTWELEQDGVPVHDELSTFESKMAFGVKITNKSSTEITFTLQGYPKLPITLKIVEGKVECTLLFGGMEYMFSGIYVHIDGSPTKPKGISLMVQMPEMDGSPLFPIYLDRNAKLD